MNIRAVAVRATAAALVLLIAIASAGAQAEPRAAIQPGSPAWVVDMFFAQRSFPEKASHIAGEFGEHYAGVPTMGSQLPAGVRVISRALRQDTLDAIYSTTLSDSANAQDWYTFLRREGGMWKIEAIRTLSFPAIHYVLLDSLEASHRRGALIDTLVPTMETMRLAIRSDSALKQYLIAHLPALRTLAERFAAAPRLMGVSVDAQSRPAGAVSDAEVRALATGMRDLRLGALLRDERYAGCIFLKIGGAGDNYVGFIHAAPGCRVPAMSPDEFIYVEEVAPGWYVYKTT